MNNFLDKIIKTFLFIDIGLTIISIITIFLLYYSFKITTIPGIGVSFGYFVLLFFTHFFINFSFIEAILGIIILIFFLINKQVKYIITKNIKFFIPFLLFFIYSIYLISEYDVQNTIKIQLILNNTGIVIWLNILLYCNRNLNEKYLLLFSLLTPLNYFLVYFILYQNMFGML